ncbi:MAG: Hsp33 family molecular chaperone HslO [Lachnospiraceae bacterium]|nr:Hsp33 family molecular chaperone HslO [Lachnospiraceae bacterium]
MCSDHIIRGVAANGQIRCFAAYTKETVETARGFFDTSPVVTAALGRLLTAGAMMGSMMKGENDRLTLSIKGDGPVGGLTVTAGADSFVKGYANEPQVVIHARSDGKLDVAGAIGKGYLTVIRDMGLKEPYNGSVELVSGEIAQDITYYFASSEQVPSSVGLGVLMNRDNTVKVAGGFIIQLMPFAEDAVITQLEANLQGIDSVTSMLSSGMSTEDMLKKILEPMELEVLDTIPTGYRCDCSRERVLSAIASLGRADLESLTGPGDDIEVQCHFCNKKYSFTAKELERFSKK